MRALAWVAVALCGCHAVAPLPPCAVTADCHTGQLCLDNACVEVDGGPADVAPTVGDSTTDGLDGSTPDQAPSQSADGSQAHDAEPGRDAGQSHDGGGDGGADARAIPVDARRPAEDMRPPDAGRPPADADLSSPDVRRGCPVDETICDGVDDNCNGLVDETFPRLGEGCSVGFGVCAQSGSLVCTALVQVPHCDVEPLPRGVELCNGLDDDCDDRADEDFLEGLGDPCAVGVGECVASGINVCRDGDLACDAVPGPQGVELCDGLDNNCDDRIDEDFVARLAAPCSVGTGRCEAPGTPACSAGGDVECLGEPGDPVVETCDATDEDCDGNTDEDFPPTGSACTKRQGDACQVTGTSACAPDGTSICEGPIGPGTTEACDGFDNDCDTRIDEGVDRLNSEVDCGACGQACGPLDHADATCQGGECFIARCHDGYLDDDTFSGNGCEDERPGRVILVDAGSVAPMPDGSDAAPFPRLQQGLAAAADGDVVRVLPGQYVGPFTLDRDAVTVRGDDRDHTFLMGGIDLRGTFARLESVTVDAQGRDVGIKILCPESCTVANNVVTNVGQADTPGGRRAGIVVSIGTHHTVHDNQVLRVRGAPGDPEASFCFAGPGGDAAGIRLEGDAGSSRITGNLVTNVEGGPGGAPPDPEDCLFISGAPGGLAVGIDLSDSGGGHTLAGNRISDIQGGEGATGRGTGNGGSGGLAAGILLANGGNRVLGDAILEIVGGQGGPGGAEGFDGSEGTGQGIHLAAQALDRSDPALNNVIARTTTVDSSPVIYCFDQPDYVVSGLDLTAPSNPTNLGKIVLIACDDARVEGNTIAGYVGEMPATGSAFDSESPGRPGVGILLADLERATVLGNAIDDIEGGNGGTAHVSELAGGVSSGGNGGSAAGIFLSSANHSRVEMNTISGIRGGDGANGNSAGGAGGRGGFGAGVHFDQSVENTAATNTVTGVVGGLGGQGGRGVLADDPEADEEGSTGGEGVGFGFYLNRRLPLPAYSNYLEPDNFVDGEQVVYFTGVQGVRLADLTLVAQVNTTNLGKIVVAFCDDVEILRSRVAGVRGEPGDTGTYRSYGVSPQDTQGISVIYSTGVELAEIEVFDVLGGPGGSSGPTLPGGPGGTVSGISVTLSPEFRAGRVHVHDIQGGVGASGGAASGPFAQGLPGQDGDAYGLRVTESPHTYLENVLAHRISGRLAAGVDYYAPEAQPATHIIDGATVDSILAVGDDRPGTPLSGNGIHTDANNSLFLVNAIASNNSHYGFEAGAVGVMRASYSNAWNNGVGPSHNVIVGVGTIAVDPQYLDQPAGNYALAYESPCVDAGDPNVFCAAEPTSPVNGCRLDMGHLAGTPGARARDP